MHDSKFVSHFINIINSNTFSTNWLNKTLTVNPSYLSIAYDVTEIVLWIQYAFETYYLSVCYTNQWQTIFNWWMVNLFEYFKSSISQKHPIIGLVLRIKSRKSVELPALLVLWLSVVQKKIHQIKEIKKKKKHTKFIGLLNFHQNWIHIDFTVRKTKTQIDDVPVMVDHLQTTMGHLKERMKIDFYYIV